LLDEVRHVDLNNMTPLQALQMIQQWQQTLTTKPKDAASKNKG
jgi:hypothetical protein